MFKCLEVFGFGPSLTRWLETFYSNITSCIINNGTLSDSFEINPGVRQELLLLVYHCCGTISSRYSLIFRNKWNQNRFKK